MPKKAPRKRTTILVKDKHKYGRNTNFGQAWKRYKKEYCYAYTREHTIGDIMHHEPINSINYGKNSKRKKNKRR